MDSKFILVNSVNICYRVLFCTQVPGNRSNVADYCARFVSFAFSLRLLNIEYQVYPSFAVTISDWLYVLVMC
jgi:hypothetical protein